jgi:Na+(H+)/acetate symporter ActP
LRLVTQPGRALHNEDVGIWGMAGPHPVALRFFTLPDAAATRRSKIRLIIRIMS